MRSKKSARELESDGSALQGSINQGAGCPPCSPARIIVDIDEPQGLSKMGFGEAIADDYQRRCVHFVSDYWGSDVWTGLTASSTITIFLATFASTVALSELARQTCGQYIGATEYLLLNSVAGIIHSIFGCQPFLVLRPTGPITSFIQEIYKLSLQLGVSFLPFMSWIGLFVGIYMLLVAVFGGSHYITYLTRFGHDMFAFFVCTIYIVDGVQNTANRFAVDPFAEALFELLIFLLVVALALFWSQAQDWSTGTKAVRIVTVELALTAAVLVGVAVSYSTNRTDVNRVLMPSSFSPTGFRVPLPVNESGSAPSPHDPDPDPDKDYHHIPRPWFVGLQAGGRWAPESEADRWRGNDGRGAGGVTSTDGVTSEVWEGLPGSSATPSWLPGVAAVAAIPVAAWFYVDQNMSSLLTQTPTRGLRKGSYYSSSFLVMAILNMVAPMFGLPFVTGSLPHSPQFAIALTDDPNQHRDDEDSKASELGQAASLSSHADSEQTGTIRKRISVHGTYEMVDEHGKWRDTGEPAPQGISPPGAGAPQVATAAIQKEGAPPQKRVHENRWAPILMYLLIGLTLTVPSVLTAIPDGAVNGILTYVGLAGLFVDNDLYTRMWLLFGTPTPKQRKELPFTDERVVTRWKMHQFTAIQVLLIGASWGIKVSPAGLAFPIVVCCFVPIRAYLLPMLFSEEELEALDREGEYEEIVPSHHHHNHPQQDDIGDDDRTGGVTGPIDGLPRGSGGHGRRATGRDWVSAGDEDGGLDDGSDAKPSTPLISSNGR